MTSGYDHRYALPPGHRLGEYRIERKLGSGGSGITYLATDKNLNLQVAIKEYMPSDLAIRDADNTVVVRSAEDEDDFECRRERFKEEARSLASFNDSKIPNIVLVHRFFEAHGNSYTVMEYVEGDPLSVLLERKGTLTEAEIQKLILPVANGLKEVHGAGLLHRDINPGNIIRNDGEPVLVDFGSVRPATGMKSQRIRPEWTSGYAPPEQYDAESRQWPATDIYALGAVLYRCVTGKRPYDADARKRAEEDALTPATDAAAGRYDKNLLATIDAALELRMEDRPQDIPAFLIALGDVGIGATAKASGDANTRETVVSAENPHECVEHGNTLPALQLSAKLEHADAQYCLGRCYYDGKGMPRDHKQAARWFQKAAQQGHADAQFCVGRLHYSGEGMPKDHAQAFHWFRKAAEQGLHYAQECLGLMCFRGEGMPIDYEQAASWLRRAADQGHSEISFDLHIVYQDGEAVPEVNAQAVQWFQTAADKGLADAQLCLGLMYLRGQGVQGDYAQAFQWFRAAAHQGLAAAQYYLGIMDRYGMGEPKDYAQAVRWFREASARGHSGTRLSLHSMYENGEGVPEDDEQAILWFRQAAERGLADAQYYLGLMYLRGERVSEDEGQAVLWIRRAAQQGLAEAQYHLGQLFLSSQHVPEDHLHVDGVPATWIRKATEQRRPAAIEWIRKAAEQGLAEAQYDLGCRYRRGQVVPQDEVQAVRWFVRASGEGHYGAERELHILLHDIWVPSEKTALPWEMRRALLLPGRPPKNDLELLDRLQAKLKWLIADSKEEGNFDMNTYLLHEYYPFIPYDLRDCLNNTEVLEANWAMQHIAKQALSGVATEPRENWTTEEFELQRLGDWLGDLNEGFKQIDS